MVINMTSGYIEFITWPRRLHWSASIYTKPQEGRNLAYSQQCRSHRWVLLVSIICNQSHQNENDEKSSVWVEAILSLLFLTLP